MPSQPSVTIGIDIGDRYSHLCVLDTKTGEVIEESRITTSPAASAGAAPQKFRGAANR